MALWPLVADRPWSAPTPTGDANTASSTGWSATATASATIHVKGPWTQVIASTTVAAYGVMVALDAPVSVSAANSSTLLDIGVGAAGSEVVAIADLNVGYSATGRQWRLPLFIPAGSRVAVRAQSVIASKTVSLVLVPLAQPDSPPRPATRSFTTLGADTAASKGVSLVTSGTVNVKNVWAEVAASTAETYTALAAGVSGNGDTALLAGDGLFDIGVGAAGSEVVVVSNVHVSFGATEAVTVYNLGAWSVEVPAGSRIAARAQVSNTGNSLDVTVYGIA